MIMSIKIKCVIPQIQKGDIFQREKEECWRYHSVLEEKCVFTLYM